MSCTYYRREATEETLWKALCLRDLGVSRTRLSEAELLRLQEWDMSLRLLYCQARFLRALHFVHTEEGSADPVPPRDTFTCWSSMPPAPMPRSLRLPILSPDWLFVEASCTDLQSRPRQLQGLLPSYLADILSFV